MSYCLKQKSLTRKRESIRSLLYIFEGALFLTLLAKITLTLPFTPIPITFQTLGIYCLGIMASPLGAAGSVLTYFMFGLIFPVFCNSLWGIANFCGPTAGYLYAFPLAAACISILHRRHSGSNFKLAIILSIGAGIILACGTLGLACYLYFTGVTSTIDIIQGLKLGTLPFIPGEILKILLVIQGRHAIAFFKKTHVYD
ncbi:hypothetical protein BOKEGFJH_00467 [Chlamydia avium]|uniref:Biotin transporter n=1 Tax=Chlamydia avium TaxID=1457141 RepID=A0ABP2X8A0_9CHLA|nr:biotin transporter BioY [Chlamydia avium]EPP36033.1 bioY family protein [Chlamydia psittaci 10_743_SC13]EPP38017.1 bioY family protein [Chlamydia avium]VVT42941.1 hypothetical protein BOKEGFJH_00467 [Chlamydia avium]